MPNLASTEYRIDGTLKAVKSLWKTLQGLEVNKKAVWLSDLAEHYGIDYNAKQISVRGYIYWAEYTEDKAEDFYHISIDTSTAWNACNNLFEEINHCLDDELSISYRVIECGCEIYYVHDEGNYFPEKVCVSSDGGPFEVVYGKVYDTIADAIKEWCSKMNIEQGERTDEEMMDFINEYEYDTDDTFFYIRSFRFE